MRPTMTPTERAPPPFSSQNTGERLVRIETILEHMTNVIEAHIRQEEKDRIEMRDELRAHIHSTGSVGEDVRTLIREVHDMKGRLEKLEGEVNALSKARMQAIAWATGAAAVVSTLWVTVGEKLLEFFH